VAIPNRFLGHYIGASEGFQGMIVKSLRGRGKVWPRAPERATALFMILSCWAVATSTRASLA
jgi:serine transporter